MNISVVRRTVPACVISARILSVGQYALGPWAGASIAAPGGFCARGEAVMAAVAWRFPTPEEVMVAEEVLSMGLSQVDSIRGRVERVHESLAFANEAANFCGMDGDLPDPLSLEDAGRLLLHTHWLRSVADQIAAEAASIENAVYRLKPGDDLPPGYHESMLEYHEERAKVHRSAGGQQ